MKNILITGAQGQLGSEIQMIKKGQANYFFTDIASLDITHSKAIDDFVTQHNIQVIVNCAAYTHVDKAQQEPWIADLINRVAVANLTQICKRKNITLIHISTDYVFSGNKNIPYTETDVAEPMGVYGKTKLEGEKVIQDSGIQYIIVRTSWLYSFRFGHNFVKTIQQLSSEKTAIRVVFDQIGTPTLAFDLALFIVYIVDNELYKGKREIYHFSNQGVCSWYDFAVEIVHMSGNNCEVNPCLSEEYPNRTKRPSYSVLDKSKVKNDFGYHIRHWREAFWMPYEN